MKGTYTLKVTNPGDAPAQNITVIYNMPSGFKFEKADQGGQPDLPGRMVKWFIPEVAPGQSKEVKVELTAIQAGDQTHKVIANAARGIKAEQELITKVEGIPACVMQVTNTPKTVEVGSDTSYQITLTNSGSKAETDVKLICTVSPLVRVKSVQAETGVKYEIKGNEVIFEPIAKLHPKSQAIFKIIVTTTGEGVARFHGSFTAGSLIDPVVQDEVTTVYRGD